MLAVSLSNSATRKVQATVDVQNVLLAVFLNQSISSTKLTFLAARVGLLPLPGFRPCVPV